MARRANCLCSASVCCFEMLEPHCCLSPLKCLIPAELGLKASLETEADWDQFVSVHVFQVNWNECVSPPPSPVNSGTLT